MSYEDTASIQDTSSVWWPIDLGPTGRQSAHSPSQRQDENPTQEALESSHVHILFARLQDIRQSGYNGKVVQEKVRPQSKQRKVEALQRLRQFFLKYSLFYQL